MAEQSSALLEALLDSWDRNNRVLVNLLRALPEGGMEARALQGSPNVARLFAHVHYVRLVFVQEDAPECAREVPAQEWDAVTDREQLAAGLEESARAVREAVATRLAAGRPMQQHYDHPVLFLTHMIWHEGYHHGQIKLALKAAGLSLPDETIGPLTWDVFMSKTEYLTL